MSNKPQNSEGAQRQNEEGAESSLATPGKQTLPASRQTASTQRSQDISPTRYLEQYLPSSATEILTWQHTKRIERSGPLPDAEEMARFKAIDPDIPVQIVAMAKSEQGSRHDLEAKVLEYEHAENMARIEVEKAEVRGDNAARIIGASTPPLACTVLCATSIVLALNGQETVASNIAGGIAAVFGAGFFINLFTRRGRYRDRTSKDAKNGEQESGNKEAGKS